MQNQRLAKILEEIAQLLDIKGAPFYKLRAYRRAAESLEKLDKSISKIYKKEGLKGIKKIPGIGQSIALKIEEFLQTRKIKFLEELDEKTRIKQIIAFYFGTKGINVSQLKINAKRRKIIYSRYTKPAKQLLELAGSVKKAKAAIDKVAQWASSRNLDYAIETVFKKWLELDRLKPKEIVKKPYFQGNPMIWSETKRRWFVIDRGGTWLEFAGKESEIEWRIENRPR